MKLTKLNRKIIYTNLILACGHILYVVPYQPLDHQMGEAAWCPTCGLTGITEVESTYELTEKE